MRARAIALAATAALVLAVVVCGVRGAASAQQQPGVVELTEWQIYSDADPSTRYDMTGPVTVLAGLIQAGVVSSDLFYGLNLQSVNPVPYLVPWWYATTFAAPAPKTPESRLLLRFKGINYRANVFLNGVQLADNTTVVGTFRYFTLDITDAVSVGGGGQNTLLVQVFPPVNNPFIANTTDLAMTFVDWAPFPPDANLGLWREVELIAVAGEVSASSPMVVTATDDDFAHAQLTVVLDLTNYGEGNNAQVTVSGTIADPSGTRMASFSQGVNVRLGGEPQSVSISYASNPQLVLAAPQLWWPWQMGAQALYTLALEVAYSNGQVSDSFSVPFGIRTATDEIDANGHRRYSINGQPLLLRGAGYCPELLLRSETNAAQLQQWMNYVRHMGLNVVRFEGKHPTDAMYDMADRMGVLMIPGWCCCDSWQHWSFWGPEQHRVAQESTRSQAKRLRIHPSVLSFWFSSDELPPADIEAEYRAVFADVQWPATLLASASALTSNVSGPTGVKMSGPYSWVPPSYWLTDVQMVAGGAWGLLTEGGPGEAPMTLESMERTVPPDALWPISQDWTYHCGGQHGFFGNLNRFTPPLQARYNAGAAFSSAWDYLRNAQADNYAGMQAMFEAYSRNKYMATGVVQWMLNSAWPENIWHLFDGYLNVGGGYFGARKACSDPLHVQWSYDDSYVYVVNNEYTAVDEPLTVVAYAFDFHGDALASQMLTVTRIEPDSAQRVFSFPIPDGSQGQGVTFMRLYLLAPTNSAGAKVVRDMHARRTVAAQQSGLAGDAFHGASTFTRLPRVRGRSEGDELLRHSDAYDILAVNTYWLPVNQNDVLDWDNSTWYNTPCTQYADLAGLQGLQPVTLQTQYNTTVVSGTQQYLTTVSLISLLDQNVAFGVRLRLLNAVTGIDVTPIFWSDNYLTLIPGDEAVVTASYAQSDANRQPPKLVVETFNGPEPPTHLPATGF